MYSLIIVVYLMISGESVSVNNSVIDGFKTEKSCLLASQKTPYLKEQDYGRSHIRSMCVYKGE